MIVLTFCLFITEKCFYFSEHLCAKSDLLVERRTNIPKADLERIIDSIQAQFSRPSVEAPSIVTTDVSSAVGAESVKALVVPATAPLAAGLPEDKKLKGLRKKLDQIEALKVKQSKGEKLEANQVI